MGLRTEDTQRAADLRAAIGHLSERERATLHGIRRRATEIDLRDRDPIPTTPRSGRALPRP